MSNPPLNQNTSFESGTSPWTPFGSTITQSNAQAYVGSYSLLLTPDGVTLTPYAESEHISIPSGGNYTASSWIYYTGSYGINTVLVAMNWYDTNKEYISTSMNATYISVGQWVFLSIQASTPPKAKYVTIIVGEGNTPSSSSTAYFDAVQLIQSNVPINQNYDFSSGLNPWTASNGMALWSTSYGYHGTHSAQLTPNGTSAFASIVSENVACIAGNTYDFASWCYSPTGYSSAQLTVTWYNSSGASISTNTSTYNVPANRYMELQASYTAPTGAVTFTMSLGESGTPPSTAIIYFATARAYFDPSVDLNVTFEEPGKLPSAPIEPLGGLKYGSPISPWPFTGVLPGPIPRNLYDVTAVNPLGGTQDISGVGFEVKVYWGENFGSLLSIVPRFEALQFSRALNNQGSGSITLNLNDPIFTSDTALGSPGTDILDYENLWQIYQDGALVFEFLGETVDEVFVDSSTEEAVVTISGPDTSQVLQWCKVLPPGYPNVVYPLACLTDPFTELSINTAIWNACSANDVGSNIVVDTVNAALEIKGRAIGGAVTAPFAGAQFYNAQDSYFSAQVAVLGAGSTGATTYNTTMTIQVDASNYAMFSLELGVYFHAIVNNAGMATTITLPTYDSTIHTYWRIRELGGLMYFDTSSDGNVWNTLTSIAYTWSPTNITLYLSAWWTGTHSPVAAEFSNMNAGNTLSAEWTFINQSNIGGIFLPLLEASQSRGTATTVIPTFTATHDSKGNLWTDTYSVQIANGGDLLSQLETSAANAEADWIMNPNQHLNVYVNGALGKDTSFRFVIYDSGMLYNKERIRIRNQIANYMVGTNGSGTLYGATNPTTIQKWQQREGYVDFSNIYDTNSLQIGVNAALQQYDDEILSWTITTLPTVDGFTIFKDYDVGDFIGVENSDFSSIFRVRVIAAAISIDNTGLVQLNLTLQTRIQLLIEQMNNLVNKIASIISTTAVGGTNILSQVSPVKAATFGGNTTWLGSIPTGTAGSSTVTLTHNLNTTNVGVNVYDSAGNYLPVGGSQVSSIKVPSASTVSVTVGSAPANLPWTVLVSVA